MVDIEADYRRADAQIFAWVTDVSRLGIFVRTNNPEPTGTLVCVRFTPPGEKEPLLLDGEVAWTKTAKPGESYDECGMGVKFINLGAAQQEQISALMRDNSDPKD